MTLVYIGSYGSGVRSYRQDPTTGSLAAEHALDVLPDPSFLAWHPFRDFLYTVSGDEGSIAALAVSCDDGSLSLLNLQPTGGQRPCHVTVDPEGRFAVAANYGDGSVSVHPLAADGRLGPRSDLVQHHGSGPGPDRQQGPHTHMVAFTRYPETLLVTDLGTDQVLTYRLSPDGRLALLHVATMAPGSGPRHVALHPQGGLFVCTELDSSVEVCQFRAGALVRSVARRAATVGNTAQGNYPSHIECSADGRFVYVANRGANCLSVFAADPWQPVVDVATGGDWPRHFALIGDFAYVANQRSGTITVARMNFDSGVPGPFRVTAEVPGASCVLAKAPTLP